MPSTSRLAAAALGATAIAGMLPASVVASTYVVRPGDTIGDIAIRHGTTVRALADANAIADPALLRPGAMLRIPDASLALPRYTAGAPDAETYAVRRGEGVIETSRHFGVDPTALARVNGVGVNAPLSEGDELLVPGRLARFNALITHVAGAVDHDARVVRAVAWVESRWRQEAISATGAVGIMQLEPSSGKWVSIHLAGRRLDIWNALDNVTAGSLLLRHLLEVSNGDQAAALAGYYQGLASIAEVGVFEDTRRYQQLVESLIELDQPEEATRTAA
jgi:soluble lytic murein transglycosylase-like protein